MAQQHEDELTFQDEMDASRTSHDKLQAFYDKWAGRYEDILGVNITTINNYAAERLSNLLANKEESIVLDIPCGTGFTGAALQKSGLKNIHGADMSDGMLNQARSKGIYRNLFKSCISATSKLDCEDNTFDGVTCILSITRGHLHLDDAIPEFVRVTKNNAVIVFTVNLSYPITHIMELLSNLVKEGKIEVRLIEKRAYYMKRGENHECHFVILRRTR